MKNRIAHLDVAWDVYEEWLHYCEDCSRRHVKFMTFAEWLHIQYKEARRG